MNLGQTSCTAAGASTANMSSRPSATAASCMYVIPSPVHAHPYVQAVTWPWVARGLLSGPSVPGGAAKGHVGAAAAVLRWLQHILVCGDLAGGDGHNGSKDSRRCGQQWGRDSWVGGHPPRQCDRATSLSQCHYACAGSSSPECVSAAVVVIWSAMQTAVTRVWCCPGLHGMHAWGGSTAQTWGVDPGAPVTSDTLPHLHNGDLGLQGRRGLRRLHSTRAGHARLHVRHHTWQVGAAPGYTQWVSGNT
jgi:hypothetical protein